MSLSISLADLALVATGTQSKSGRPAFYTVSVEEARSYISIKDGNRKPAKDDSQALTVVIGKFTLPLDCIKPGTSRLGVTADQVEAYTAALQEAVNEGLFDEVIAKAQENGKAQAEKAANAPKKEKVAAAPAEETEGLNLDELDTPAEAQEEEVDTDEEL